MTRKHKPQTLKTEAPAPDPRQALTQDTGPFILVVAVNRITGKATIAQGNLREFDLQMALEAVRLLEAQIETALLHAAEKRGRESATTPKE